MSEIHEQLRRYAAGCADELTAIRVEEHLLKDDAFFDSFVDVCEASLLPAPDGLASSVMQSIRCAGASVSRESFSKRKIAAAVCFCTAAALAITTALNLNPLIIHFFMNTPDRFFHMLVTQIH